MENNKNIFYIIAALTLISGCVLALLFYQRPQKATHAELEELEEKASVPKAAVQIAIVLDDWGYNLQYLKFLEETHVPLTIAVLPNLKHSAEIAEQARKMHKEVLLHLPLEPENKEKLRLEKDTITSDMTKEKIIQCFKTALQSVPNVSGVSNHMGSRATKDPRIMSILFAEIKKANLFFLDNMVTEQSVCGELAKKMQVKIAERDVFLDNSNQYAEIKKQLDKLVDCARISGRAIGNGHARPETLAVLKEQIPLMEKKGIKFIFISEMAKYR
ncbi:MAG: divergent polysaccharide deacetylase family protein [Candidatus Omnitrophota bacterium]